jgi:uncharacterized coiled-coil DUF342 family protein
LNNSKEEIGRVCMNDVMSELGSLNQKIDYCLNAFHKIKDENDDLRDGLSQVNKEILLRDEKIDVLKKSLQEKEKELQELVAKLEKILD